MDGATHVVTRGPRLRPPLAALAFVCAVPGAAAAQTIPFADTEDATLSEIDVGDGDLHPVLSFDVRNGDYARGGYDDDDAGLGRVPVHLAIGGVAVLHHGRGGAGDLFLIGQSSNGFHAPATDERQSPRGWYESNTLVGLAARPAAGLSTALLYTIKTSPNAVANTTHEASLSLLYGGGDAIGRLKPRFAVTRRTRGAGGIYTIVGIAPEFALAAGDDAPSLTLSATAGTGWGGFYGAGTGTRSYGSGGAALAQPLRIGGAHATLQAELLVLVRDDRLRLLDAPGGTTHSVVPYATVSFAFAW